MKTLTEIKETIEETKYRLKLLRSINHDCCQDPIEIIETEAWINALEWCLDDDYYEQKPPIEEDLPLLTRCLIEEATRQD